MSFFLYNISIILIKSLPTFIYDGFDSVVI